MSFLQTVWLKLSFLDKAVIIVNLVAITIYFVQRNRKKRALAKTNEGGRE